MSDHISLVTQRRPHFLALKGSNATTQTSVNNKYATSTLPASGTGSIVLAGAMNYMKISPRFTNAGTSPTIRVIGWSKCNDSNLWIPHLLTTVVCTLDTTAANGQTINGTASMFGCSDFSKTIGDCKIYPSTGSKSGGFIVVDTVGSELVELAFSTTTTAASANAHIGEI